MPHSDGLRFPGPSVSYPEEFRRVRALRAARVGFWYFANRLLNTKTTPYTACELPAVSVAPKLSGTAFPHTALPTSHNISTILELLSKHWEPYPETVKRKRRS